MVHGFNVMGDGWEQHVNHEIAGGGGGGSYLYVSRRGVQSG